MIVSLEIILFLLTGILCGDKKRDGQEEVELGWGTSPGRVRSIVGTKRPRSHAHEKKSGKASVLSTPLLPGYLILSSPANIERRL